MDIKQINWRLLIKTGLLFGIGILYVSVVGMLEAFNERDIIYDTLTLGQLLLVGFSFLGGYFIARRAISSNSTIQLSVLITNGAVVGFFSSIPTVLLVILIELIGLRDLGRIFANINRPLERILTFDQPEYFTGLLILMGLLTAIGAIGAATMLLKPHARRAVFVGLGTMLIIGTMSELVTQVLQQNLDRAFIRNFFNRSRLLPGTAVGIFIVVTAITWFRLNSSQRRKAEGKRKQPNPNVRIAGFSALGIFLLALPWLIGPFLSEVADQVGLYILMGLGLNIAVGLAGLLDLGYVTNFAVGAYVMSILTSTGLLGLPKQLAQLGIATDASFVFWTALPICIIAAMITGFIFAVPVLRMRGDYLAIATLGFGEIIRLLALSDWLKPVIGGAQGILDVPKPIFFGTALVDPQQIYYILLGACLLALFVSIRLNNSRIGRQWMAIREDEDVAAAMGISTARSKLLAFTLSAATGGLAGGIFAAKVGTVFPNSFTLLVSINVLSLIIVGGMGSIPGIVLGALVLIGMPELLREFSEFRLLLYGALLIVMMLARPEGLWPSAVVRREIRGDEDIETAKQARLTEEQPAAATD